MDWNRRKIFIFGIALAMAALLDVMSPQWTTDLFAHSQVVASGTALGEQNGICTMEESINECL